MFCMTHQQEYRRDKQMREHLLPDSGQQQMQAMRPALAEPTRRQLVCCTCNAKITYAEAKFCWGNERRFGGLQYCRTHQIDWR
jgi:hypothetical protein